MTNNSKESNVAGLLVRIGLIALVGAVLQIAAISQISLFGVTPDLTPLFVGFIGLLAGSVPGAIAGFCFGFVLDLALLQTLGVSSLVYLAVGYSTGRIREIRDYDNLVVVVVVGAFSTCVSILGFVAMNFLLGIRVAVTVTFIREILIAVILNALLSIPLFALVKKIFSAVLPEEQIRRRRRKIYSETGIPLAKK